VFVILLALLAGCMQSSPLPDLGPCADYPDGVYEYGQVGIGTCVSGPTDLVFQEAPDGSQVLVLTNSNPYLLFTGGSLLSIPWDAIDLDAGYQPVHEVSPVAVDLPTFAGAMDVDGSLGLVGVRLSEESRTRQAADEIHLFDLTDPLAPVPSTRGTDGSERVEVRSDPVDIVVDPSTRFAFVANRTSHSVSVLDLGPEGSEETIEIILPWPESTIAGADFDDADASGSRAELSSLEIIDEPTLQDDSWTLDWVAGTWRLWLPDETGLLRYTSTDVDTTGGIWDPTDAGLDLDVDDSGGIIVSLNDPFLQQISSGVRMLFETEGDIRGARTDAWVGNWGYESYIALLGDEGSWAAQVGGPSVVSDSEGTWLWYHGLDEDGLYGGIGLAASTDDATFSRESSEPVLVPTWDHELERISEPFVLYDAQIDLWRMYYSAYDGTTWTIGHATSIDRLTWSADPEPVFALPDADAAAPAVTLEEGRFRLWYAHGEDDVWDIGYAESTDGSSWTDIGPLALQAIESTEPVRPAVQANPTNAWRIEGEVNGVQTEPIPPGISVAVAEFGWALRTEAGFLVGTGELGSDSNGGVRVDTILPDNDFGIEGRAWLTMWDSGGTPRIGTASVDAEGSLLPDEGAVFEGTDGFDRDGVHSPVVFDVDGTLHMLYAGDRGDVSTVGLATSSDGSSWTRVGEVLANSNDWDSTRLVPGGIELLDDGSYRLWYAGGNGESWAIGSATSTDGESWTRDAGSNGYQFGTGSPGDFDDSGVRTPYTWRGTDAEGNAGVHLWYSGFDGANWRIGYAFRADGETDFVRSQHPHTEESRAVVGLGSGWFHPQGVERPVLIPSEDADGDGLPDTWLGTYAGSSDNTWRIGGLRGQSEPDRLHKVLSMPTVGDSLAFDAQRGDADVNAIPLDTTFGTTTINGVGLVALSVDEERGFLYAISKLTSYIIVIDIRDDTDEVTGFIDRNYLDIEAILSVDVPNGAEGFRQVAVMPGRDRLYALHDQPESIMVLDISELSDESYGRILFDVQVGWLPTSRGRERDAGADSQTSVGPAQLLAHPDGRRLFVTNFNTNSIGVYDLDLGPYGTLVAEVDQVGENPYAIVLHPDEQHVVFANYTGKTSESGYAESTLAVLDVDESSPTYLQVLTWIGNR